MRDERRNYDKRQCTRWDEANEIAHCEFDGANAKRVWLYLIA
jgi:hypothetical protein